MVVNICNNYFWPVSACSFDPVPGTSLFPLLFVLFIFANPRFKEGKKFAFLYQPQWQWCHRANVRFKGEQSYHNKSTHSKKHNSKPAEKLLSCITRGDADCFLFVCFFIMDKCVTWVFHGSIFLCKELVIRTFNAMTCWSLVNGTTVEEFKLSSEALAQNRGTVVENDRKLVHWEQ